MTKYILSILLVFIYFISLSISKLYCMTKYILSFLNYFIYFISFLNKYIKSISKRNYNFKYKVFLLSKKELQNFKFRVLKVKFHIWSFTTQNYKFEVSFF